MWCSQVFAVQYSGVELWTCATRVLLQAHVIVTRSSVLVSCTMKQLPPLATHDPPTHWALLLVGLQLFHGKFWSCNDPSVPDKDACTGTFLLDGQVGSAVGGFLGGIPDCSWCRMLV